MTKYLFFIFSCFISLSVYSDSKIDWQLGSSPKFVEEAQKIFQNLDNKIKKQKGIRQLLLKSEIDLGETIISNRIRKIWYFADASAMQDYGTDIIYFDNLTEKIKVLETLVIKPDGKVVQFDKSKALINDSDSYNSFSDTKKLIIPYPSLQTGSIAIIDYVVTTERNHLEGHWSKMFLPQYTYPRDSFKLSITDNSTKENFKWSLSSKFIKCNKNENKLTCLGEKIPPQTTNDSIFWYDKLGQINISEADSWQRVIKTTNNAFNSAKTSTDGITELLETLTKNKPSLEEKIESIHKFIATDIRYVAVSSNGHSITPHQISETIKNRYGDCKDKSILLIELLNKIGVKAYPVLVSTKRTEPSLLKLPAMNYFNHVVACFPSPLTKKTVCLDATDSNTGWKDTSAWIQGKASLVLKEQQKPSIIPVNNYRWSINTKTDYIFLKNGNLEENQTRTFFSEYASSIRETLKSKTPEQLNRWALERYQETISNKVKPTFEFSDLQDLNKQISITSKTEFKLSLDTNNKLSYYDNDYWLKSELNDFYMKNKEFESFISGLEIHSELTYKLSNIWKVTGIFPQKHFNHKFGEMDQNISLDNDIVSIKTDIRIPAQTITLKDKDDYNKFLDILKRESGIHLIGKPTISK